MTSFHLHVLEERVLHDGWIPQPLRGIYAQELHEHDGYQSVTRTYAESESLTSMMRLCK